MVREPRSVRKRLAVLALGAVGGAVVLTLSVVSPPESRDTEALADAAAPANLQARLLELEAASEALAEKLARARRELSEL
jgi:hypothetical protein